MLAHEVMAVQLGLAVNTQRYKITLGNSFSHTNRKGNFYFPKCSISNSQTSIDRTGLVNTLSLGTNARYIT